MFFEIEKLPTNFLSFEDEKNIASQDLKMFKIPYFKL